MRPAARSSRGLLWIVVAIIVAVGVPAIIAARQWPFTRDAIIRDLQEQSGGSVQLAGFRQTYFPHPGCIAEGVTIRRGDETAPFITMRRLVVIGSYPGLFAQRVAQIRAEDMHAVVRRGGGSEASGVVMPGVSEKSKAAIGEIIADGAQVEIDSQTPGQQPLLFLVQKLSVRSVADGRPLSFHAVLELPEPPGDLSVTGQFGPGKSGDFGQTPLSGSYTLERANLGVFNGIAGTLSSTGKFSGVLQHVEVSGKTDVPDFEVTSAKHGVHLSTDFRAVVDGLNGDVVLDPVTASWGRTTIVAKVNIAGSPEGGGEGKTVTLTAYSTRARTEDLLRLFTKDSPPQVVVTDNVDSEMYQLSSSGGTVVVSPVETALYTATATGPGGRAQASTTVTVLPTGSISAVNHVIFLMQENRSFDHYFGQLNPYRTANGWNHGADGKEYDVDGTDDKLSRIYNQDDEGADFYLFHTTSSCLDDMTSAWLESFGDVSRYDFTISRQILMDGFVHTAENYAKGGYCSGTCTDLTGQRAMAYYEAKDYTGQNSELNYYYWMASQFALSDCWFSPVASKSIPNRIAAMSGGTTQGYVYDPGNDDHAPQLGATTIFQLLDQHGISWKIYYAHTNSDGSPSTTFTYFSYSNKYIYKSGNQWIIDHTHVAPISQYYTDVANGALPQFAYIETNYGVSDEHPGSGQSIFSGQQFVAQLVNSLMNSRSWSSSVFFLSYDEAGGPYDHVPPVPSRTGLNTDSSLAPLEGDVSRIAVNPDSYWPCQPSIPGNYTNHCDLRPSDPGSHPNDVPKVYGFAGQIGFRVPNMIISPFTRKHYVGHVTMDHTAVLRFVEERFNLPSLTARDAAQPDLYDYFDFSNPPWATPPSGVPTAPPVGSTCHASNFVP